MLALITYAPGDSSAPSPGIARVRRVANACYSMGIDVIFIHGLTAYSAAQWSKIVGETGADMIICPYGTIRSSTISIENGQLSGQANTVPYFLLGNTSAGPLAIATRDATNSHWESEILSTGGSIYTSGRHFTLNTASGSQIITGLVQRKDDPTLYASCKFSPDNGVTWAYYDTTQNGYALLHLLVQEAINDGVLVKPPKRAARFLNIDHINSDGNIVTADTGGTVGQPEIITTLGDILREADGVCYANLEQNEFAAMTDIQKANLLTYNCTTNSDAGFRYIACHDHSAVDLTSSGYTTTGVTPGAPLYDQETKSAIDASYAGTKAAIEGIGLNVWEIFAHFAGNVGVTNFYELGQVESSVTSDPANITAKAGYGFRMARIGSVTDTTTSWPGLGGDANEWHFNKVKTQYRGIVFISSRDGGSENGAVSSAVDDLLAFQQNLELASENKLIYHHEADFEVAANNPIEGLVTDGTAHSRGVLTWQTGLAYQSACPDTFDFGSRTEDVLSWGPVTTNTT